MAGNRRPVRRTLSPGGRELLHAYDRARSSARKLDEALRDPEAGDGLRRDVARAIDAAIARFTARQKGDAA